MDLPPRPRTAVIGVDGYLGNAFYRFLRAKGADAFATSRRPHTPFAFCNLAERTGPPLPLRESGAKAAIISAGISGRLCGERPDESRTVNVDGVTMLIRNLWLHDVLPVFLSTDQVFDGQLAMGGYDDGDVLHPTSEYGRQKAEVERFLADSGHPFLAVRLGKVFGLEKGDGTLLDDMARLLSEGQTVRAAVDQVFCPTLLGDVVEAVWGVLTTGVLGAVNVCSPEAWSRHNLAMAIAERMGADPSRVEPVSLESVFPGMRHPKRTVLICRRLREELGFSFTPMALCIGAVAANYPDRCAAPGGGESPFRS